MAWQSLFVHYLDGSEQARPHLTHSLALLDDARLAGEDTRAEMAHARWCEGRLLVSRHREQARTAYEQCLSLYRSLGDRWGEAKALAALGGVAWNLGDYRQARLRHEASLAIRQALGDRRGIADSLMSVGVTSFHQGEVDLAGQFVQRGCMLRQALGDRRGHADGLRHLGVTRLLSGEFGEAVSLLEASLEIYRDLGLRFGLEVAMLGEALVHQGAFEAGQVRAEEALAIAHSTGYRRAIGYALLVLGEAALARDAFEEAGEYLAESVAVYHEIEQWDEWCRALATQAYARRGLGCRPWTPPELLAELGLAVERGAFMPLLWALPVLALLLADAGETKQAAELNAVAACYPALARSAWFALVLGRSLSVAVQPPPRPVPARILQESVVAVLGKIAP
jgi:tetratricopeptide (TPR) repeat protein